jgi:DEAD/DEAH box helicase domain-containing protein
MKQIASLLLMCDARDLGVSINAGDSVPHEGQAFRPANQDATQPVLDGDAPRIFLYDAYPGGIGFSEPLFSMHADLMGRTRDLIAECPCENGCPSCVGPVGQTGPLAKTVALRMLDHLTSRQTRDVTARQVVAVGAEDMPF